MRSWLGGGVVRGRYAVVRIGRARRPAFGRTVTEAIAAGVLAAALRARVGGAHC